MKTTGRKFKCIGLREIKIRFWSEYFTIGEIYEEQSESIYSLLKLIDNDGDPMNVDASQFELIK